MKRVITKSTPNFFKANTDLLIAGGVIVVLAGAGFTWYYLQKKKRNTAVTTSSKNTSENLRAAVQSVPKTSTTSSYPLQYGSRHSDVKILQRYLKIYKADIGSTGSKRDGVDGIFGPKTAKASKKQLGKSIFTASDIDGMRRTLKTMGK